MCFFTFYWPTLKLLNTTQLWLLKSSQEFQLDEDANAIKVSRQIVRNFFLFFLFSLHTQFHIKLYINFLFRMNVLVLQNVFYNISWSHTQVQANFKIMQSIKAEAEKFFNGKQNSF